MSSKNILITGATDGIGRQTAVELARKKHHVIIHGRNLDKCIDTVKYIEEKSGNSDVEYVVADFSKLQEIRDLAEYINAKYNRLDVLINNAGVYMNEKILTEDGFETTFAVNHLAPFLLTNRLFGILKNSQPARIINVSSIAHTRAKLDFENINAEKSFDSYGAYALSKLANVLFTNKLAEILEGTSITANSLHPGVITTKLLRKGFNITGASLESGAATSVYLADSDEIENVSGKYFVNKEIAEASELSNDKLLIDKFWNLSEEFVGL